MSRPPQPRLDVALFVQRCSGASPIASGRLRPGRPPRLYLTTAAPRRRGPASRAASAASDRASVARRPPRRYHEQQPRRIAWPFGAGDECERRRRPGRRPDRPPTPFQQQPRQRRRGPFWQAMNSGVRRPRPPGRPPRRYPATAAPRRRGPSRRRRTAASRRPSSDLEPPSSAACPAINRRSRAVALGGDDGRAVLQTCDLAESVGGRPPHRVHVAPRRCPARRRRRAVAPFCPRSTSAPFSNSSRIHLDVAGPRRSVRGISNPNPRCVLDDARRGQSSFFRVDPPGRLSNRVRADGPCPATAAPRRRGPRQAMNSGAASTLLSSPVASAPFLQQQPRRVDVALKSGAHSGVSVASSPDRPPRLCPAAAAPRRPWPSEQANSGVWPSLSARRPPRLSPATAAPRRRGRSGRRRYSGVQPSFVARSTPRRARANSIASKAARPFSAAARRRRRPPSKHKSTACTSLHQ